MTGRPQVRWLPSCGSTNAEAAAWLAADGPHGAAVVAAVQTEGRGRRGRSWWSPEGGLWVSFLLRPELPADRVPMLALAAALAAAEALESLGVDRIALKWPNDLLLSGRKFGGLLAELHPAPPGGAPGVVLGLGIDLDLPAPPPEDLAPLATSIRSELGWAPSRESALDAIQTHLLEACRAVADADGTWLARYRERLLGVGGPARVDVGGESVRGTLAGVGPRGELLIDTPSGRRAVLAGDVHLIAGATAEP